MTDSLLRRSLVLISLVAILLGSLSCGSGQAPAGRGAGGEGAADGERAAAEDAPPAPEPAESPTPDERPAGRVVEVGSAPEGLAADPKTGLVVVGLRNPDELALVDGDSGETVRTVDLPESARHLDLAGPGGPVLVPAERADALVRVGLPEGEILDETPVGKFPHDAAAVATGRIFVADEFGHTLSVVESGRVIEALEAPLQPGSVAATDDGLVGVVGVRGLALEVFEADTLRSLGRVDAGEGPTHVVTGLGNRFYVADTRGDAVLVYEARPELEQVASVPLPGGTPYGIAVDPERDQLWVTLTAENSVVEYALEDERPRELARYPTVRQPNTVAVDPASGRVFITGSRDGTLQILDPR